MYQRPIAITALVQQRFYAPRPKRPIPTGMLPKVMKPSAPPATWPVTKQLALLTIAQKLSETAADCMRHMREHGIRFDQADLVALREEGLAFKRDVRDRFHQLTPTGKRLADECADIVARNLGLHHISYRRNDIRSNGARCTCGWSIYADERYGRSAGKIDRAVSRHMQDLDAWKRGIEGTKRIIDGLFPEVADDPGAAS